MTPEIGHNRYYVNYRVVADSPQLPHNLYYVN
jgi:hypothetical protein